MSRRYLGGFITANPTIPTASSASGSWTLSQQNQYASTWPFGGPFNYIEDVFSAYLYAGNSSTQTITNGIDLAGKGGLVWQKVRNTAGYDHVLTDTTTSGTGSLTNYLSSNTTNSFSSNQGNIIGSYNSNGFTLNSGSGISNVSGTTNVSWTFRKQPKFFDVVTYTGNGNSPQTISHSLGSVPGFVIIKRTDASENWQIAARRNDGFYELLDFTTAASQGFTTAGTLGLTSTSFDASAMVTTTNGATYVAYLFAHNAGGFGLTGTDNVISCGGWTTSGSGTFDVNLGYEPQLLLVKRTDAAANWLLVDNMRGFNNCSADTGIGPTARPLFPNTVGAESSGQYLGITTTGFNAAFSGAGSKSYIYMAIRRGPMRTPTVGTSVFYPTTYTETVAQGTAYTGGFPVDALFSKTRNAAFSTVVYDKLRGTTTADNNLLFTALTDAETDYGVSTWSFDNNTGVNIGSLGNNTPGRTDVIYQFRRAPGFFDIVCYTGTGSATTFNHNLGVVPELMIVKRRSTSGTSWFTYSSATGNTNALLLDTTDAAFSATAWNNTTPTSSVFSLGTSAGVNGSGSTYVAYLFASVAGVSKVGSYAGTGATQTINCGFTSGARFVLIKRTNDTGNWFVWDTARGMVAGTDPFLLLNTTDAESNINAVYTVSTGFQIVSTNAELNASGSTYIYLAIA